METDKKVCNECHGSGVELIWIGETFVPIDCKKCKGTGYVKTEDKDRVS